MPASRRPGLGRSGATALAAARAIAMLAACGLVAASTAAWAGCPVAPRTDRLHVVSCRVYDPSADAQFVREVDAELRGPHWAGEASARVARVRADIMERNRGAMLETRATARGPAFVLFYPRASEAVCSALRGRSIRVTSHARCRMVPFDAPTERVVDTVLVTNNAAAPLLRAPFGATRGVPSETDGAFGNGGTDVRTVALQKTSASPALCSRSTPSAHGYPRTL